MKDKDTEPVTFRWRKFEDYMPPRVLAAFCDRRYYIGSGDEKQENSRYEAYLKEEINDRMKRHNPVLNLFDIREKLNPNSNLDVDYFAGEEYLCTCTTAWDKSRVGLMSDDNPFAREVTLSDNEVLKIWDREYNYNGGLRSEDDKNNTFSTKVVLYRVKEQEPCESSKEIPMDRIIQREPSLEQEMFVEYIVDAYNRHCTITVSYKGAYLEISSDNYYQFRYSDGGRVREIKRFKGYTDNLKASYEGTYKEEFGYDLLDGKISVTTMLAEDYSFVNYNFIAGFGKDRQSTKITEEQAANFAHAIVSHERSKETMRAVIRFISKKIPKIIEFISENFAPFIEFLDNDEYHIPEIDEIFNKITNPYLAFGEDGFVHKETPELDEAIMKDKSIKRMSKREREKLRRQKLIAEYLKKHREDSSDK